MSGLDACWICQKSFAAPFPIRGDVVRVNCHVCGEYGLTGSAASSNFPLPDAERFLLSFWCKQRGLDGREPPRFDAANAKEIAATLPRYSPSECPDLLLASLSKAYPKPGNWIQIDFERDYSLACAADGIELRFYLQCLEESGYTKVHAGAAGQCMLTSAGWNRVEQLHNVAVSSRSAFVAMRFNEEMLALWEPAFLPAIEGAGFKAELSGNPPHNDRIDAKIIVAIKQAKFVVADVTFGNQGVYFEAGYAAGLGRPVIWTCRKGNEGDMHFDTRQYNHVIWVDADDLKIQLRDRIIATI